MVVSESIELQMQQAETRVFKVVFPEIINHHNTMFGGRVILMMTETAFMTATRFCRKNFVIVNADKIDFLKPIPAGSLIEMVGNVESIGNTSIRIRVNVFREKMKDIERVEVVSGVFTLVAINDDNRPVRILD
ncbi:YiiD C-terminal domain-containing protein [Myroides albus]|uniref:Acyl-CoA thioesterase n=1 Tax=Myroides albus TaxID=2562892 RepID=A0A6I3LKB1_9FLAO|nr:hotdog domain-containing protein [Myroides albus]MTG97680.1 acyl-CoA thioesterase [Myroides albus]UVD78774.1 YiiD C-terminal domain-containing protein [Myroides albus]